MNKVIIGIVSKHYNKDSLRPNMYIRDEIKQAIFDNGAVAIGILLPKDEKLNLENVAICEDVYPDVVESKNKKFYMGVRFHPESLYKIDKNMNNIFKYFIDICNN